MNYVQVTITVPEEQQDILISALSDIGTIGFEQTSTDLIVYFDELNFNSYEVNKIIKGHSFQVSILPEQNWNTLWESNFEPVIVGAFCAIRADFHPAISSVEHEIVITPKMSFGTGHHATTYMMIQQMEQAQLKNRSVFD